MIEFIHKIKFYTICSCWEAPESIHWQLYYTVNSNDNVFISLQTYAYNVFQSVYVKLMCT